MNALAARLVEVLQRQEDRRRVRAAVAERFEVTANQRDRLRRTIVYGAVAKALGVQTVDNEFCARVRDVVVEMGGLAIAPHGPRIFACLRAKDAPTPEPRRKLSNREVGELRRKWYMRAREAGFEDIEKPNGDLKRDHAARADEVAGWWATRAEINTAFFSERTDFYWKLKLWMDVWKLYTFDGLDARDIAKSMGFGHDKAHRIIKQMDRLMGHVGRRGKGKETSTDEDEPTDLDDP